jgi:tetratricopeptide (TPR) repeat protein
MLYECALAIDPSDKYTLNDIGYALNGLGNHTMAITYFDKTLAIDPKFQLGLSNKGWALVDLGNYKEAMIYLDKALAIDPGMKEEIAKAISTLDDQPQILFQ